MTEQEIKAEIEQHRKDGDLIDWIAKIRCDEVLDTWYEIFDFLELSEEEEKQFEIKKRELADKLCIEHKNAKDWEDWLEKKCHSNWWKYGINKAADMSIEDTNMADYLKTNFSNEFHQKYSEEIQQHREQGDLIDYLWDETEKYDYDSDGFCRKEIAGQSDYDYEDFSVEYDIIQPLLTESEQIEIHTFFDLVLNIELDEFEYILNPKEKYFKMLYALYNNAPDSLEHKRFQKLRKLIENAEAGRRLDKLINATQIMDQLKPKLINERNNGDIIWFMVEYVEDNNINYKLLSYYDFTLEEYFKENDKSLIKKSGKLDKESFAQKFPLEAQLREFLREFLSEAENDEISYLLHVIHEFDIIKHYWDIQKMSKKKKKSIEYSRYLKLREKLGKANCEKLDERLKKDKFFGLGLGGFLGIGIALILFWGAVIIGSIFGIRKIISIVSARKNKVNIELEQQRTNNENLGYGKITTSELMQLRESDLEKLNAVSSTKVSKQEILFSTSEPSLYVIAPMSYDTKKFVEDNSHDKTLLGTKDNSAERLTILESCITDFQNSVDTKTGVSFLDRSKIEQIEKEHKFQLGDWSNNIKTAEVGKALNANILLFLDKFGFIDKGSGEYRFEAKFVDINTMQTTSYNVVYQNAKKKIVTPGVVQTINFRDFTPVSTKKNPFADEFELKTLKAFRTVQKNDVKDFSPLSQVTKVELSKYDTNSPASDLFNVSSIYFDGFGSVEFNYEDKKENSTYTFDAIEMNLERMDNLFYTDGKIGVLTVKTENGYEKFEVFTSNNHEYYFRLGFANLDKVFVNYYLEMIKK